MASGGGGGQTLAEVVPVVGTVAVVMVRSGDNNSFPEVYGSITAVVTSPSGDRLSYTLFHKARDQAVQVPENTPIPVQMTKVPAQLGSEFQVYADLWDAKGGPPDHQIVKGSVAFTAKKNGTDSKDITAPDGGDVRVDVSWSTNPGELCRTMASGGGGGGGGQTLAEVVQVATVDVLMVKSGHNNPPPQVYGSINLVVTSPSNHQSSYNLFEKARDQAVEVKENTTMPLRMTQVPAEPQSQFEFDVDLSDAKVVGPLDPKIVKSSVSIIPPNNADITAGGPGDVRVNATWSQ